MGIGCSVYKGENLVMYGGDQLWARTSCGTKKAGLLAKILRHIYTFKPYLPHYRWTSGTRKCGKWFMRVTTPYQVFIGPGYTKNMGDAEIVYSIDNLLVSFMEFGVFDESRPS